MHIEFWWGNLKERGIVYGVDVHDITILKSEPILKQGFTGKIYKVYFLILYIPTLKSLIVNCCSSLEVFE
jgi:hypothetical protein